MEPIYLDNAATTRPLPSVIDAISHQLDLCFGNPSSPHGFADAPRRALNDAREFLRGTVGAAKLVFTSGGTEADLLGVAGAARCRPPGRVLVGAADHPAVLAQERLLGSSHRVVPVPVTDTGVIEPQTLFELLGKDVRVVSLLHGHNELGSLTQIKELAETVRRVAPNAHIHVDLVQAYGKIPFDLDEADADSVAVSGHKFHGPRGAGFLALSSKARLDPLQEGGGQELGMRGGTENVAGAVGIAIAAEAAMTHMAETAAHTLHLGQSLFSRLEEAFPRAIRLGDANHRLPHILSLRLPGIVAGTLQERCSHRGLAFSTGSACHDPQAGENHVLEAIGLERRARREVLRLSFSHLTTQEETEQAAEIIIDEAEKLARVSI